MQTQEFIEKTQRQIAKGQLDAALEGLTHYLKDKKTLFNDVINQSGRFSELQNQIDAGTILPQEAEVQKSQIRTTLLNILDRLEQSENKTVVASGETTTPKKKPNQMILIGVGIVALVIAGIFVVPMLTKGNSESNDVTAKVDSLGKKDVKKQDTTSNNAGKSTDTDNSNNSTSDNRQTANTGSNPKSGNTNQNTASTNNTADDKTNNSSGKVDYDAIKLDVQVKTDKQAYLVSKAEDIKVFVKVNKPSYVTVIYNEESGKKAVLKENKYIEAGRVGQWVMVSNGAVYASSEGSESVFAVALSNKLPNLAKDGDGYITTDLTNWLKGVEQKVNSEVGERGVKKRYSNAKYNFKSQ